MKRLKVLLIFPVIFTFAFALAGCSTEKAVKTATGGTVDVDKKGNVEIKDKSGKTEMQFEKAKWDKEKMHGLAAPKAKLDGLVTVNGASTYSFTEMNTKDALAYIQKIKDAGFTYNYVSIDEYNYTGSDSDGRMISFLYTKESKSGVITSAKDEKPPQEQTGMDFMGGTSKWDSSLMGGLPEPDSKITASSVMGTTTTYNFDNFENPTDYITKIKEHGFTLDPYEEEIAGGSMYSGKNSNGDKIDFMTNDKSCTIIFTKAGN